MFVDRSADDYLFFFLVSGWSFVYEGCYGQGAEQLPALSTGGGRSAQEESGNYKEPQDLNTITHTPSQIKTTLPPHHQHHHHHQPLNAPHRRLSAHQPTHESDKPRLTRLDPARPARRAHSRYWPPPFFFFFLQPGIFFFVSSSSFTFQTHTHTSGTFATLIAHELVSKKNKNHDFIQQL